jgi:hypothetical protein
MERNMNDELANRKLELQRALCLTDGPDSKASMRFLHGLIDGLAEDDLYRAAATRRSRHQTWARRSIATLLRLPGSALQLVERAPGFRLVGVLKFFCRRKTSELVIEPMHADFLLEYYALLRAGERRKAAVLQAQMHVCLVVAVVSERVLQMLGTLLTGRVKARPDK